MSRRIVTAHEQHEMLAPWRVVAAVAEDDPLWSLLDPASGGEHVPTTPTPPDTPRPSQPPIEGVPVGWERYYQHIREQPDTSGNAHLMMPTDLLDHYREYDRPTDDPQAQTLKKVITEHGGIRQPLILSTSPTHGLLTEGNNRLALAKEMGISHLPVKVYHDDRVQANEGTPVEHHPDFMPWLQANKDSLPSFWRKKTSAIARRTSREVHQ